MPFFAKTLSRICLAAVLCMWASVPQAQDVPSEEKHPEETYAEAAKGEPIIELDPYYTDIAYSLPLTQKPVPTITSDRESVIYRDLIRGSLIPRYMVLQANVYPVPALSAYIKSHSPSTYRRAEIGTSGINLLESATVEFQEPWSVSAFFGNVAKLERPQEEEHKHANYGYTGYTFSAGNKHLKFNTLIPDDWYELEWTIKGKLDYPGERLSWRFRAGARFHTNKDINDVAYISLHRSNLNLHYPVLEWLENANYEVRMHFLQRSAEMVRLELIAGRKVPIEGWSFTPTLDLGLVWTSPDEYSGALRGTGGNTTTLVLRPSIEF